MKENIDEMNGKRIFAMSDSANNDRNRAPLDEELFRQIYFYTPSPEKAFWTRTKKVLCKKNCVARTFPIVRWLPAYQKKYLMSDVIAGLTVAVMHIPQGMAYALLGGVPPVVGIYMAFFPVLMYIILGTSPHVSMGTFAVVCMMVGKSVDTNSDLPQGNSTGRHYHHEYNAYEPTEVATAVCLVVGLWQVLMSVLRLGSLSVLLSQTLVSGFTTGAAVHVLTSQIKHLFGINVHRYSGPLKIIYSFMDILSNLKDLNVPATILSASFIAFLIICNEVIKPCVQKKLKKTIPLPVELLVVVIGTLLSKYLRMKEEFNIPVVDFVPTGLPRPAMPSLALLPDVLMDGLVISVVAISINLSMATIFSQKLGYDIDGNQEILASGVGNIFSSFFSCMPFAASLSRSLIQESVGGKTQITSVVSSLTLLFVLLFVGPFFEPLPYCVLSTIIVVALKGMLKQINELPCIYRNSKLDGMVWIATFVSVVVLDIDYGLGIGLMASVASLVFQSQNAKVVILGRVPNSQVYLDLNRFSKAQILPGILILQVVGGLHFANANSVKNRIVKSFHKFSNDVPKTFFTGEKQSKCLSLVIDLSCVPFMDPSAIKTFKIIYNDMKMTKSNFFLCGCLPSVYESLEKCHFFGSFPKSFVYRSVQDAVDYAKTLESRSSVQVSRF